MAITEADGVGYRYNVTWYDEADATDSTAYYLRSSTTSSSSSTSSSSTSTSTGAGCIPAGTLIRATDTGITAATTSCDNLIGVVRQSSGGHTWISQHGIMQLGASEPSTCTTAYYGVGYRDLQRMTAAELRMQQENYRQRATLLQDQARRRLENQLGRFIHVGVDPAAQQQQPVTNMTQQQGPPPNLNMDAIQQLQQQLGQREREIQQHMNEAIERMSGITEVNLGQPRRQGAIDHERRETLERRLLELEREITHHMREQERQMEMEQGAPLSMGQQWALRHRAEQDLERGQRELRENFEREMRIERSPFPPVGWANEVEQRAYGMMESGAYDDPMREINRRKEEAEHRAQELLGQLIGKNELEVYKETGHLFVRGKKYNYILPKSEGFIKKIGDGKVEDICVHLEDRSRMPITDNVVAIKMFLETNEKAALKMANTHRSVREEDHEPLPRCAGMSA